MSETTAEERCATTFEKQRCGLDKGHRPYCNFAAGRVVDRLERELGEAREALELHRAVTQHDLDCKRCMDGLYCEERTKLCRIALGLPPLGADAAVAPKEAGGG